MGRTASEHHVGFTLLLEQRHQDGGTVNDGSLRRVGDGLHLLGITGHGPPVEVALALSQTLHDDVQRAALARLGRERRPRRRAPGLDVVGIGNHLGILVAFEARGPVGVSRQFST